MLPSRILLAIVAALALGPLYWAWTHDGAGAIWVAPPLVLAAVVFVLGPQIDWAVWRKYPPDLPDDLRQFLEKRFFFYQKLAEKDRFRFRSRTFLAMHGLEWMAKGFDPEDENAPLPEDLKLLFAAHLVFLTWAKPAPILQKFETVVVYRGPFPSPAHPVFHASEIFEADGVLLFSADSVIRAVAEKDRPAFNLAFYEWARAFKMSFPNEKWPPFGAEKWSALHSVGGLEKGQIESAIGLPEPDILAVAVHHFFVFEENFRADFPAESALFDSIFGKNTSFSTVFQ